MGLGGGGVRGGATWGQVELRLAGRGEAGPGEVLLG